MGEISNQIIHADQNLYYIYLFLFPILFDLYITLDNTYLRLGMVDLVSYLLQRDLLGLDGAGLGGGRRLRRQRVLQVGQLRHDGGQLRPEPPRHLQRRLQRVAAVCARSLDVVP